MMLKHCRLTEKQQDRLIEFFVGEMTARTAADLVGVNKTTAAYFFHRLREIIAWRLDEASPLAGEVEVDESYFGGKRKSLSEKFMRLNKAFSSSGELTPR